MNQETNNLNVIMGSNQLDGWSNTDFRGSPPPYSAAAQIKSDGGTRGNYHWKPRIYEVFEQNNK